MPGPRWLTCRESVDLTPGDAVQPSWAHPRTQPTHCHRRRRREPRSEVRTWAGTSRPRPICMHPNSGTRDGTRFPTDEEAWSGSATKPSLASFLDARYPPTLLTIWRGWRPACGRGCGMRNRSCCVANSTRRCRRSGASVRWCCFDWWRWIAGPTRLAPVGSRQHSATRQRSLLALFPRWTVNRWPVRPGLWQTSTRHWLTRCWPITKYLPIIPREQS